MKEAMIHLGVLFGTYLVTSFVYQHILYPRYRWHQRGNVCHDEKRYTAAIVAIIAYVIFFFYTIHK